MSVLFLPEMFPKARKAGEMILSPVPSPELEKERKYAFISPLPRTIQILKNIVTIIFIRFVALIKPTGSWSVAGET